MIKFEAEKTCNLKLVSTKKFALKSLRDSRIDFMILSFFFSSFLIKSYKIWNINDVSSQLIKLIF